MARREYKTVRISKEAYEKINEEAGRELRTFIMQLEVMLNIKKKTK